MFLEIFSKNYRENCVVHFSVYHILPVWYYLPLESARPKSPDKLKKKKLFITDCSKDALTGICIYFSYINRDREVTSKTIQNVGLLV